MLALIQDFLAIVDDVKNIGEKFSTSGTWPATIDINEFVRKFPEQLFHYLIIGHLERYHRGIYALCRMIDAIHVEYVLQAGNRLEYTSRTFDLSKLTDFVADPKTAANTLYSWGSDQFEAQRFLDLLEDVCIIIGLPAGQYLPHPTIASRLLEIPNPTYAQMGKELRIPIYEVPDSDIGYVEAGISVYPIPDKEEPPGTNLHPGIAIIPYINGSASESIQLGGGFELTISGDLSAGFALEIRPGKTSAKTNLLTDQVTILNGELKATISRANIDNSVRVFEGPGDSYLAINDISHSIGVSGTSQGDSDAYWELNINGGQFAISAGEGDGFLQKILPNEPITAEFDITTGWSSARGVYFGGSGTFEITIPVHKSLGPLSLESIYITIIFGEKVSIVLAVTAGAEIGPVAASVERIGVEIPIALRPNNDGNLGPIQLNRPKFKPPLGAGLAVSAGPVTGGGKLGFDPDNERYDGMLQLKFGEIGLTAVGLITTRMPDGSKGFSMLAFLNVEFTPPIQLSFGFTLSAVGGLVGIHRTMILEVLREGVRNGTLDSVLFPQDPIANAARIISDLRSVFPPEEDRFVVGPMVRIGYGSPEFITAEIAVIIELPPPVRIALLGQIAAFLPKPEKAVVVLHIDVLGTIDTEKQLLTIDATIYDSRILTYALSGDAALRLKWGDNPIFALSLGGFHPKFSPPPNFPSLRRMRLSLGTGNNPRFNCDAYQALTSNSLQFGARVEVYAKFGATLQGHLGFDALIYFSPFGFDVSISGGVSARYKGRKLAAIRLRLNLSGPTPWYAEGTASFEILWWDVDVHFEKTWGPRSPAEIEAINPWEEFKAALNLPESWGSKLPAGRSMVASLRSLEEEASTNGTAETDSNGDSSGPVADTADGTESLPLKPIVVHPAGTLEVRQKVLPLAMKLSRYGNAPIAGYDTYDIGTGDFTCEYTEDFFARGQYESLSNSDKVSKPSYELMKNGVAIRARDTVLDDARTQEYKLQYESDYIDDDSRTQMGRIPGLLDGWIARRLLAGAASRKNPLRTTGRSKYARMGKAVKVAVGVERFAIVNTADMTRATGISENDGTLTQMAADQLVRSRIESSPETKDELLVVPSYEVAK